MKFGSRGRCHQNPPCVPPRKSKSVRFVQEVMDGTFELSLAWTVFPSLDPAVRFVPKPLRSIVQDSQCKHGFDAQREAFELQFEMLKLRFDEIVWEFQQQVTSLRSGIPWQEDPLSEMAVLIPVQDEYRHDDRYAQWTRPAMHLSIDSGVSHDLPGTIAIDEMQNHNPVHHVPEYVQNIQNRINSVGPHPEGRPWLVRTWYVHHRLHPRCDNGRYLRLGPNWQTWHEAILEVWEDNMVMNADVVIMLPLSDVPMRLSDDDVIVDVLLIQDFEQSEQAVFITYRQPDDDPCTTAISVPHVVSGFDLTALVYIENVCKPWNCRITCDDDVIDFTLIPSFQTANGQSIVASRIQTQAELSAQEYTVDQVHDSEVDGLQAIHIHRLHQDSRFAYITWRSFPHFVQAIGRELGIHMYHIQTVHYVDDGVDDALEGVTHVIAHMISDIPAGSTLQLVLLDIEAHVREQNLGYPIPPRVTRRVELLDSHNGLLEIISLLLRIPKIFANSKETSASFATMDVIGTSKITHSDESSMEITSNLFCHHRGLSLLI